MQENVILCAIISGVNYDPFKYVEHLNEIWATLELL